MTLTEIAWAAGLFDGEGHISAPVAKRVRAPKLYMHLSMTEEQPVRRFHEAVTLGTFVTLNRKTVTNKTVWRWQAQAITDVHDVIDLLRPYLSEPKMKQAQDAFDKRIAYETSGMFHTKTRCRNGHSFPENRREWPNGKGYCVTCLSERKERTLCVQ